MFKEWHGAVALTVGVGRRPEGISMSGVASGPRSWPIGVGRGGGRWQRSQRQREGRDKEQRRWSGGEKRGDGGRSPHFIAGARSVPKQGPGMLTYWLEHGSNGWCIKPRLIQFKFKRFTFNSKFLKL
jgi:hypothetical protein